MIKKFLWPVIGLGLLVWSGLAYMAYGLVGWGGNLASGNADMFTAVPEAVEWLSWGAVLGTGLAEWLIIGIWGVGVVLALMLGALAGRLFPRAAALAGKFRL